MLKIVGIKNKYQPSGAMGARSLPATPHPKQNSKRLPGGIKMADKGKQVGAELCQAKHSLTLLKMEGSN